MNNQFPFQHGYDGEKRYPDDPAQLLEELARIRQEIEQDSAGSFRNRPDDKPLSCSKTENSVIFESILNSSDLNQSHSDSAQSPQCGEFRSFYRFDSEHIDGVSQFDDNEPAYKSDSTPSSLPVLPPLFPSEQEAWPEQARENKVVAKSENAQNRRRFDQAPMIIPIHGPQHSKDSKGRQSSKRAPQQGNRQKTTKYGEYCDDSYSNFTTPPMLPWHSFSQYENETFFKLVANASSCQREFIFLVYRLGRRCLRGFGFCAKFFCRFDGLAQLWPSGFVLRCGLSFFRDTFEHSCGKDAANQRAKTIAHRATHHRQIKFECCLASRKRFAH
jgi:hypothetical protein